MDVRTWDKCDIHVMYMICVVYVILCAISNGSDTGDTCKICDVI